MVVSNYTTLMSGAIDGGGATYTHAGETYSHGNVDASVAAQGLRDIGVPVSAYDDLSLRYLIRLGFVNDAGEFSCRFLHDGQGWGAIELTWNIPGFQASSAVPLNVSRVKPRVVHAGEMTGQLLDLTGKTPDDQQKT